MQSSKSLGSSTLDVADTSPRGCCTSDISDSSGTFGSQNGTGSGQERPEELIQPSGLLPCTINVKVSLLQTHPTGVCTKLSKLHSSTPNHSFQRTLSRQTPQCCICKEHIFICCESGPSREFRDNCGCWHTNTGKESGTKYP